MDDEKAPVPRITLIPSEGRASLDWIINYALTHPTSQPSVDNIPSSVNLVNKSIPVYDQGDFSSCTANAIAGAMQFDQMKENFPLNFVPSRLFIWWYERKMENKTNENAGTSISDGIKAICQSGACQEDTWPYDPTGTKYLDEPSKEAQQEASTFNALDTTIGPIDKTNQKIPKGVLAQGNCFVFGFKIYAATQYDVVNFGNVEIQKGYMNMPGSDDTFQGCHAVVAMGYDDEMVSPYDNNKKKGYMIVRNSWSSNWGDDGYFYMPYEYFFSDNVFDLHQIHQVTNPYLSISIKSCATVNGDNRYLDCNPGTKWTNQVSAYSSTNTNGDGTHWEVIKNDDNTFSFKSKATVGGKNVYLDCNPSLKWTNEVAVYSSPSTDTGSPGYYFGTHWTLIKNGNNDFSFKTKAVVHGDNVYLDSNPSLKWANDVPVYLSPDNDTQNYSGTRWKINFVCTPKDNK